MTVSSSGLTFRGFGATPLGLANNQIVRVIESSPGKRSMIRNISVGALPGTFTAFTAAADSILPIWVFRGPSSDNIRPDGLGLSYEQDYTLGGLSTPLRSSVWPALEILYLGYVSVLRVASSTLKFPRGSLVAQNGQFLAVVTTSIVRIDQNPPLQYNALQSLVVNGTEEWIDGDVHPSVASPRHARALPRYDLPRP